MKRKWQTKYRGLVTNRVMKENNVSFQRLLHSPRIRSGGGRWMIQTCLLTSSPCNPSPYFPHLSFWSAPFLWQREIGGGGKKRGIVAACKVLGWQVALSTLSSPSPPPLTSSSIPPPWSCHLFSLPLHVCIYSWTFSPLPPLLYSYPKVMRRYPNILILTSLIPMFPSHVFLLCLSLLISLHLQCHILVVLISDSSRHLLVFFWACLSIICLLPPRLTSVTYTSSVSKRTHERKCRCLRGCEPDLGSGSPVVEAYVILFYNISSGLPYQPWGANTARPPTRLHLPGVLIETPREEEIQTEERKRETKREKEIN